MKFQREFHADNIAAELWNQQQANECCDITLKTEDGSIKVHRCVLFASSEYFRTLGRSSFVDRSATEYNLPSTKTETVEKLVKYMYVGSINIENDSVQDILCLADFLCISHVKLCCKQVMRDNISEDTCLNIKLLADQYHFDDLAAEVVEFMSPRFLQIMSQFNVVCLPFWFIDNLLRDERLTHIPEQDIHKIISWWLKCDPTNRLDYAGRLAEALVPAYMTRAYIRHALLQDELCMHGFSQELINTLKVTATEPDPENEDIVVCRSRCQRMGEGVRLLSYSIQRDEWWALTPPKAGAWDGLESIVQHQGDLYLLTSQTEDMYGYMHHAEETKYFWKLDTTEGIWTHLASPRSVTGVCRLVPHVNGIFVIDRAGQVEEYDFLRGIWKTSGRPGFLDCPRATWYITPMPADRYIYVLRVFSSGYSCKHAELSYNMLLYDTVDKTWELLSEREASELDMTDKDRIYGYTYLPGKLILKNEMGYPKLVFSLTTKEWLTASNGATVSLPSFIRDIWGTVNVSSRVFLVGRVSEEGSKYMFYDHERKRFKSVTQPPISLSGLLCHIRMKLDNVRKLAT